MKDSYHIQITRADNGFIIAAQSDEPGATQKRLVATDEAGTKAILYDLANDSVFAVVPAAPLPGPIPMPVTPAGG